jgi:3-isopropylmalate/(R)-2-methylmalate dehydratase small subunit
MSGRAFVFGDNIDTDVMAPGVLMKLPPEELAKHCLAAVDPDFARTVQPGDFVVGGRSFGIGSSREQSAVSLRILGVRAVIARSFARIFWRNAINLGLACITLDDAGEISAGDQLDLDLAAGQLSNLTTGRIHRFTALPPHLMAMMQDGGLMPHLKKKLSKGAA